VAPQLAGAADVAAGVDAGSRPLAPSSSSRSGIGSSVITIATPRFALACEEILHAVPVVGEADLFTLAFARGRYGRRIAPQLRRARRRHRHEVRAAEAARPRRRHGAAPG
jgi:hypothetical protein